MKLAHIISDTNIGGAGRYLLTYLRNCDRSAFEVSVIVPAGSLLVPQVEALGFPVFQAQGIADRSISRQGIRSVKSILRGINPDIVHTHATLSGRVAARLCGVSKVVYTRHSVFPQKAYLTKGPGKAVNGFAARLLADGVIAVAKAAGQNLTDTGVNPNSITVIYNGVDPMPPISEEEKADYRASLGIGNEPVAAIVARMEEVKGHRYFIDAAKLLKERGVKCKFLIAGTGTMEQALKQQVKDLGLEDTVLFTGFLKDTAPLNNIMDVQVSASFGTEAASLALLEGMSLGKPSVVSDFGGNPELVQDGVNGFVVPQRNPQALADKLQLLFEDKELAGKMGQTAQQMYRQRFTSQIMTQQMERFYKNICGVNKK